MNLSSAYLRLFKSLSSLTAVVIFFALSSSGAYGQRHEIGVTFGGMYYLGDLNPSRQFAMTKPSFGAVYRLNINDRMSLRANLLHGTLAGDDAVVQFNRNRNLSFTAPIWEGSAIFEFTFLPFVAGNPSTIATPFVMAGFGLTHFNPKTMDNSGIEIYLRDLNTEDNTEKYSLFTTNMLFGIGIRYNLVSPIVLTLEWSMRSTGTDFIDDVSGYYPVLSTTTAPQRRELSDRSLVGAGTNQGRLRGNPDTNDWYSFAGLSITFRIKHLSPHDCP